MMTDSWIIVKENFFKSSVKLKIGQEPNVLLKPQKTQEANPEE